MPRTSSKSVSKAVPKRKVPAKTKRVGTVAKKPSPAKKQQTKVAKAPKVKSKPAVASSKITNVKKKAVAKKPSAATKAVKKTTAKTKSHAPKKDIKPTRKTVAKRTKPTKSTRSAGPAAASRAVDKVVEVTLPTRMSIRAREKALVLADTFEKDFYVAGLTMAKAGGICFLILGTLVTYSQLTSIELQNDTCLAGVCNTALVSGAVDITTAKDNPRNYVDLLADVPDIVDERVGIPMQFSTAEKVRAYVRYVSSTGRSEIRLAIEPIGNNKFETYIDPENLDPNQYELMVSVNHTNNRRPTVYSLGFFAILDDRDMSEEVEYEPSGSVEVVASSSSQQIEKTFSNQNSQPTTTVAKTVATTSVTQVTSTTDKSVTDKEVTTEEGEEEEEESLEDSEVEILKDEQPANIETEIVKAEQLENEELELVRDKIVPKTPVRISANQKLSGVAEVSVLNVKRGEMVSFYIRPLQTLNTQSIGRLISGVPTFRFETRSFPNGQYQLYAERQQGQNVTRSNTIEFSINNVLAPVKTTPAETVATGTERQLFNVTGDLQTPIQQRVEDVPTRAVTDFSVQERARSVLSSNPEVIDDVFQRYSVAEQSGDPALITEAKKEIQSYRERLLSGALNDERDRLFAKELEVSLGEELDVLIKKVQIFETVRRDRTEANSATDTDGDGISDFDEVNLYNTDPTLADTDNDGFTDGAEIIRGFNPNDAAAESAIAYQSPKETVGVVTTEKLLVNEVLPEVELSSNDSSNNVRAVVRGKGLPNSFVTLFVYSTPTIVTVRTEADGSFEYTFTKELEDGQHEVFVALTDNTGSIIAQSEVFTFIKEAQAFTPVDAQAVDSALVAPEATSQLSPYRTVMGMSVFALGILLILLGVGLRSNKPDALILKDNPV